MKRPEAIVAALAWTALIGQITLNISEGRAALEVIWSQLRFFTILTNLIVAIVMTRAAITGLRPSAPLSAAVTVWITVVMLVYHGLLSRGFTPDMIAFYTDHGLHTVVPLATILWWALRAEKAGIGWRDAALWCLYPIAYLTYALGRGLMDGTFPYFFIDPTAVGWGGLVAWVAAMTTLFFVIGLGFTLAARPLLRHG